MALRYERDGEIVVNAVKRNGRNSREANRPTGTEKARTRDTVEGMAVDVETAKEQAQQAIDDAANALTTSSGKNARRRGETEPSPPPGGWVQGDQWIVDNDDGKPVEVRVWDGDEFVFEQLLAAELLVVSGGGIVRLADGVVTADAIAADAIDGMIITGATVRTAATGQRLQMDTTGLRAFNSSNDEVAEISSETDGLRIGLREGGEFYARHESSDVDYGVAGTRWNSDESTRAFMSSHSSGSGITLNAPDPGPLSDSLFLQTINKDRVRFFSNRPMVFASPVEFQGDTVWTSLAISGGTGVLEWRRYNSKIELRGNITLTTSLAVNTELTGIATLPEPARPAVPSPLLVNGSNTYLAAGLAHSGGRIDIRNGANDATPHFRISASWDAV